MAVEGPGRSGFDDEGMGGVGGERRDHAVTDGHDREPVAVGHGERVEKPAVVAPEVDGDDDRLCGRQRECLQDIDLVPTDELDIRPELQQVVHELRRDATRCRARQDAHRAGVVGQQADHGGEHVGVEGREGSGHVALLGCSVPTGEVIDTAELSDALGSRPELGGEFTLDVALHADESVVAEFRGEADHGGRSRLGCGRDLGDRAERDDLRRHEQDVGDASLRRRERGATRLEALSDRHGTQVSSTENRMTSRVSFCYRVGMNVSVQQMQWSDGSTGQTSPWLSALSTSTTTTGVHDDAGAWGDEELAREAGRLGSTLPAEVATALTDFADRPNRLGALLLTAVPVEELPPTPSSPNACTSKSLASELTLLAVARQLGQPVGYAPEHGGRIVQNLVPTPEAADLQMSTSSSSNLMFHTETAFHPHRPRYLALHCLRGNPEAHTTLASIFDIIDALPPAERDAIVEVMFAPRFRTSVDASFLGGRVDELGEPHALLTGTLDEPTFVFDADLTVGVDPDACAVVEQVQAAIGAATTSVVLAPGDLMIIDNNRAVHGRSPFTARFDGTDRWLQRAFIVSDLAPSAADRRGRVIVTEFGSDPVPA